MPEWRNASAGGSCSAAGPKSDGSSSSSSSASSASPNAANTPGALENGHGASEGLPPAVVTSPSSPAAPWHMNDCHIPMSPMTSSSSSMRRNSGDPFYNYLADLRPPVVAPYDAKEPRGVFFLNPGTVFVGSQTADSTWDICATIIDCNLDRGTVRGTLDAHLREEDSIRTYWEGELIDNVNYSFFTNKWDATAAADSQHWSRFSAFRQADNCRLGRRVDLAKETHVFMRWKERFFMLPDDEESGMSIAGFYYVCLDKRNGLIEGYYFDKSSTPNQYLKLAPRAQNKNGALARSRFAFA